MRQKKKSPHAGDRKYIRYQRYTMAKREGVRKKSAQMSFLPKLNRKETRRRGEEAQETARSYNQIGFARRQNPSL
ncbi:hypothetical protein I532_20381 [Brevibacillus borstelensis AK1]|uniref:Uncharacterized protein n=1 Tax=Brevibacillus borstelensis AK1 TaxID=1300222 RepID=M8E6C1_9BACL|nr:hypothetical protein I532_20381 [Brevibacillus borstelensis AK1]